IAAQVPRTDGGGHASSTHDRLADVDASRRFPFGDEGFEGDAGTIAGDDLDRSFRARMGYARRRITRVDFLRLLRFGGCAKSKEHSAYGKATEFSLIHFSLTSHATRGYACFVPELGQNIHLPLPRKKRVGFQILGL